MISPAILPLLLCVLSHCNDAYANPIKPIRVSQMAPKEVLPPPPPQPPRIPRVVKRRSILDRLAEYQAQGSAGSVLKPWQQQPQPQPQQQEIQQDNQDTKSDFPLNPQQQQQQQQPQQQEHQQQPQPQRSPFMEHFCTKVLQNLSITNGVEISTKHDIRHIEELYRKCSLLHLLNVNVNGDGDGDEKIEYVEMKMSELDKNAKFDFVFLEDPADIPSKFDLLRQQSSILFGQGAEGCRRFVESRKHRMIRPNNIKAFYDDENDLYFIAVGGAKDV